MKRLFLLIILIAFIFSSHVFGQNFKVLNVQENLGCGTLFDMLTSRIISVIRDICHADQE